MNKACIAIGIMFIASPFYGWLDVLPNFIGAIILIYGINKATYLYEQFLKAKKCLWRLFWFSGVRFIFSLILPASFRIVIAFGFGVVELIFIIPGILYLFEGISYSRLRLGVDMGKKDITDTVKKILLSGIILQYVLSVLPESITLLIGYNFADLNNTIVKAAEDKRNLSAGFSFAAGIVIFIFLLFLIINYIHRITKSGEYKKLLSVRFDEEVSLRSEVYKSLNMKSALVLFYLAIGFSMSFYNNRIECLPNVISAALLMFFVFMLYGKSKVMLYLNIPVAVWGILSVMSLIFQIGYFERYSVSDAYWSYIYGRSGAFFEYMKLSVCEAIENLTAAAAIILIVSFLYKKVKNDAEAFGDSFLCDKSFLASLKLKFGAISVLGGVSFAFKAVYRFVLFYIFEAGLEQDIDRRFSDGFYSEYPLVISSVLSIIFIIFTVMTLSGIFETVYKTNIKRIMFDD